MDDLLMQKIGNLFPLDLVVVGLSIAVLFLIAYVVGRREQTTRDFFLGNRQIPGLAVCLSFVATEISAMTIVGVPAVAYGQNWQYLQFFFGSAAARILLAFLFIPVFYRINCASIYEYLGQRFGPQTQYAGSGCFFFMRLLGSGVRLLIASQALALVFDWPLWVALAVFTVGGIAFIALGGIKAVVWNGAYQTVFFYVAGLAVVIFLATKLHGGLEGVWNTAQQAGRLSLFNTKPSLADPKTLWAATLSTFLVNMAVFGTDQELVQRLLTAKSRRSSQKALIGTIGASLPLLIIYLAMGSLLFVYFVQNPAASRPAGADQILPHFIAHQLPMGLKGIMLSAILLASIDSPLASLATSFVTDIYRPLIRRQADEPHYVLVSRIGVAAFGVVLVAVAGGFGALNAALRGAGQNEGLLWLGLEVFGITGGALLGVFLLGILTKRRANRANVLSMMLSSLAMLSALVLIHLKVLNLGWSWLIVIGTGMTFGLSWLLGPAMETEQKQVADEK